MSHDKMNFEEAIAWLGDVRERLDRIRENPEVKNYAAEEYLEEASSSIDAALVDLKRGEEELNE